MSKNSGRTLPESVVRPIPQDILWQVKLIHNKGGDYEQWDYWYVWGYDNRDARKTVCQIFEADDYKYEPRTGRWETWNGPTGYDDIKYEIEEFTAIHPLNGKSVQGKDLAEYLFQRAQDKEIAKTNLDLPEPEPKNILEMSGYTCLATDEYLTEGEWLNHRSGDCKCCAEPDVYA